MSVFRFAAAPVLQGDARLTMLTRGLRTMRCTDRHIGFHLIPAAALGADLLLFSPPWTMGTMPAIAVSSMLAIMYWLWVETCYAHNGW